MVLARVELGIRVRVHQEVVAGLLARIGVCVGL